jgi:hypothetical protein
MVHAAPFAHTYLVPRMKGIVPLLPYMPSWLLKGNFTRILIFLHIFENQTPAYIVRGTDKHRTSINAELNMGII